MCITFDVRMRPWFSLFVQGVTGIMLPVAQVVGAPTRIACATEERGTSTLAVWIAQVFFSNLIVRLWVQCFRYEIRISGNALLP